MDQFYFLQVFEQVDLAQFFNIVIQYNLTNGIKNI